ncbi:hypothetical protein EXT53_22360, partial [Pectobacterium polaris]|nr:hypothetical protein [Pectobacterium polaris]
MKLSSVIVALSSLSVSLGQGENSTENKSEIDAKSVFQPPVGNNGSFFCTIDKDELVSATCDVTFKEINEINGKIRKDLVSLVGTDFFKYFKLDLYKQCTFWNDNNGFCVNRACAVDVVEDWDNLPEYWQPEVLGGLDKVNGTSGSDDECKFLQDLCGGPDGKQTERDIDYCDVGD